MIKEYKILIKSKSFSLIESKKQSLLGVSFKPDEDRLLLPVSLRFHTPLFAVV